MLSATIKIRQRTEQSRDTTETEKKIHIHITEYPENHGTYDEIVILRVKINRKKIFSNKNLFIYNFLLNNFY